MASISILDAALAVGLLVQMTKIGDLILRPHQQRWVQDRMDTLALYLSELQPLNWYGKAINARSVAFIDSIVSIIFFIILFRTLAEFRSLNSIRRGYERGGGGFALLLISMIMLLAVLRYGPRLRRWLYSNGEFRTFVRRYGMVLFGGMLSPLFAWVRQYIQGLLPPLSSPVYNFLAAILILVMMSLSFGAFALWVTTIFTGFMVIFIRMVAVIAAFIIMIAKAIVWRVAEYNKGAWAAFTLIVTMLVGAADVYIRAMR